MLAQVAIWLSLPLMYIKCLFSFFFYALLFRRFMDSTDSEMQWVFFNPQSLKLCGINNFVLSALSVAQVLAYNGEFCGSQNFTLPNVATYQLLYK